MSLARSIRFLIIANSYCSGYSDFIIDSAGIRNYVFEWGDGENIVVCVDQDIKK